MENIGPATIRDYYTDPEIDWLDAGFGAAGGVNGGPIVSSGYYVMPHCGRPECCRPDGPFLSIDEAREWSRANLDR